MTRRTAGLALVFALALGACGLTGNGNSAPVEEGRYMVYYSAMGDEEAGAAVGCAARTVSGPLIPGLMSALLTGAGEQGLSSPFPGGVRLLSWSLEEGRLHLDLSEQYGGLTGIDLTLADCCTVLTFCALDEVDAVYITVEGREVPYRRTQVLTAQDVLLFGAEEEPVHLGLNLWYPRAEGEGLGVEYRQILKYEGASLPQTVLSAWLEGPQYDSLVPCAPPEGQLQAAGVSEGICTVDLSPEFAAGVQADSQAVRLMLYALVNTLGELEQVDGVRLTCQGEPLTELGGYVLEAVLRPDLSLDPTLEPAVQP